MNTIPRKKSSNLATIYINLTHSHSFCLSLFNCVNIVDEADFDQGENCKTQEESSAEFEAGNSSESLKRICMNTCVKLKHGSLTIKVKESRLGQRDIITHETR